MAKNALVYLNIQVTGDNLDPLNVVPPFVSNVASPATHSLVALVSGNNSIIVPSSALYVLIIPISGATVTKIFKGVNGDTGYPISITQPTLISLAATPGNFVINSGGSENIDIWFF